ncbi:sensor domain-containing diguanylate cyclase [Domibacillus mangrovi]|uniref:GGDEF domain-containing protein n=1 Tax=Domibacillus mangrovi TaxID=1714354 RepID=A0A1Q5P6Z4_9BACI|nr:sensor domain-containing diguanylate cyclase [Domibacillus mangrovi]OKL37862.1 hypothetical protein BLL40_00035 [Domibacillus mangrovi]
MNMCGNINGRKEESFIAKEYQLLLNILNESFMMIRLNCAGKIIAINDHFIKKIGYTLDDLYMQDARIISSTYHHVDFGKSIWELIMQGKQWRGELCNRKKNGEMVWLQCIIVPVQDEGNYVTQVIAIATDITKEKEASKWKYLAYHHELTNLPNKRMLQQSIDAQLLRREKKQEKLAILFMDINQFKKINTKYGHLNGDLFLMEVAKRLASLSILGNHVYHVSGDEFIILLEDVEIIEVVVNTLFSEFREPFAIENFQIEASVSIGISIYPDHSKEAKSLLNCANSAMFEAKKESGNNYRLYQL